MASRNKHKKAVVVKNAAHHVDLITLWHEYDVHLSNRTIYLGSRTIDDDGNEAGVDARMAEGLIKNIYLLSDLNPDPITIVMNNCGGDVYHGLAIYDAIRECPCNIRVIVRGYAMSMGSIILQAANERIMGPTAIQMVHYGMDSYEHHSKTVIKQALETQRVNDWMEKLYLEKIRQKHPKYTIAQLKKLLDHDTYLTAEQSVELGLADSIG